jgi:uncharacterized protein (TIGR01244 family)
MDIRRLTSDIAVSPQIAAGDLDEIAALGFRTIINNRPDGEEATQPDSDEIEAAAAAQGLAYRHLPVISGAVSEMDGDAFAALLGEVEKPILAYCRSGTRCTMLWAMAQAAAKQATDDILSTARQAGYQLDGLRPVLDKRADQS